MRLTWSFLLSVLAWVAATAVTVAFVDAAWSVLMLLLVAGTLSAVLLVPVEALARRMPRVLAIVVVVVAVSLAVAGLTVNQAWQLEQHAADLGGAIVEQIEQLEPESSLREFLDEADVAARVQETLDRLPRTLVLGTADDGAALRVAADVALVFILTVYGILNGPEVVRGLTGTIGDRSRRALVRRALRDGLHRSAGFLGRSLAWGFASAVVVATLAVVLGIPGSTTLAVWAGLWAIVPIFGVVVAYTPLVALVVLEDTTAAVVVVAVGSVWWALSGVIVRRFIAAPTIRLGPLLVTMALTVGLQLGWLVGSAVALFWVGWAAGFLAEIGRRSEGDASPLSQLSADLGEPEGPTPERAAGVTATAPDGTSGTGGSEAGEPEVSGPLSVRSAARGTVLVLAVVIGLQLVDSARPGPTWIALGVIIGLALDPAAGWIADRTRLPRGGAVTVVIAAFMVAAGGLLLVALPSLAENLAQFDQQVLDVAEDLQRLPLVGDQLREAGVSEQLRDLFDSLPGELAADPRPVGELLGAAGDVLIGSFWTIVLAIAALLDGRRILRHARTLLAPRHRSTGDELVHLVYDTLVRYAAGSAVVSGFVGLGVFVIAVALGVPLAPVLGVWAMLWTFVPQIGGFFAAVPLVFLGVTHSTTAGVLALLGYLVLWQAKNRILHPVIVGRAVNLPPLVAMVSVLVGGAAAGLLGAILATPLVGTVRQLHHYLRSRDDDRTAPTARPAAEDEPAAEMVREHPSSPQSHRP